MIQQNLSPAYANLLQTAEGARANAFTPNTHFNVGAAVLTSTGDVFTGANMEQTAFADHAEQVAIGRALAAGEQVQAIAIATQPGSMGSACGNCRQVMVDLNPGMTEIFKDGDGNVHQESGTNELPDAYHRDHPADPVPTTPQGVKDPLLQEAYIARSNSVTKRSHYPVGAAVETADGKIFRGVELEASSFADPASRLAVGSALAQGEKPGDIKRIALVGGTGLGELPKGLSWDALEAMRNVIPQATVVTPGADGVTPVEKTMSQFLAERFQAGLSNITPPSA